MVISKDRKNTSGDGGTAGARRIAGNTSRLVSAGVWATAVAAVLSASHRADAGSSFYFSMANENTSSIGTLVNVKDEDIVFFDGSDYTLFFDGSTAGGTGINGSEDLNAFSVVDNDTILMSFETPSSIPGLGAVDNSDIVQYNFSTDSFSLYFDGSDVELTLANEEIDAMQLLEDGRIVISTRGGGSIDGGAINFEDEDLVVFTPATLGASTSGDWDWYFDGSDVGLDANPDEDGWGLMIDAIGRIYVTTAGAFSVPGVSGENEDVFFFSPTSLGENTTGSFSSTLFFDGSVSGVLGNMNGLSFPVPMPNAAWMGMGLLGALFASKARKLL